MFSKLRNKLFGTRFVLCKNGYGRQEVLKIYKSESGLYVKSNFNIYMLLGNKTMNVDALSLSDPLEWIPHIGEINHLEIYNEYETVFKD
jgi:hypothetical protein